MAKKGTTPKKTASVKKSPRKSSAAKPVLKSASPKSKPANRTGHGAGKKELAVPPPFPAHRGTRTNIFIS